MYVYLVYTGTATERDNDVRNNTSRPYDTFIRALRLRRIFPHYFTGLFFKVPRLLAVHVYADDLYASCYMARRYEGRATRHGTTIVPVNLCLRFIRKYHGGTAAVTITAGPNE